MTARAIPTPYTPGTVSERDALVAQNAELLAFVKKTLADCWCDDGRNLPECERCVSARALLAKVRP